MVPSESSCYINIKSGPSSFLASRPVAGDEFTALVRQFCGNNGPGTSVIYADVLEENDTSLSWE